MPLTKIMPTEAEILAQYPYLRIICQKPCDSGSGLIEWTMKCRRCGQVTTTFCDPAEDWCRTFILLAHQNCSRFDWLKKRFFKLLG